MVIDVNPAFSHRFKPMQNKNPPQDRDPQALDDLIDGAQSRLGWIMRKAQRIQRLNSLLYDMLDSPLNSHCQVLNLEERSVIIAADNASWATQLRFQQRDILNRLHFHNSWRYLQQITIKVR